MCEKDKEYWVLVGLSIAVSTVIATYTVLKMNSSFEQSQNEEAMKHFLEFTCATSIVLAVCSLESLILIVMKRVEFFSIWAPLFIFLPSFLCAVMTALGSVNLSIIQCFN